MHPLEMEMATGLETGEELDLTRFGGLDGLSTAVGELARSPLMPEFLRIVLPLLEGDDSGASAAAEFISRCLEGATADFAWTEAVDILDEAASLPAALEDRLFVRFLAVAVDRGLSPMARAAGLDGALRWAGGDRKRQLRLSVVLLDVTADDDPDFLARAAKAMGIAYSHWREPGLVDSLITLSDADGAADEAAFELGMAKLADGLDASDRTAAASAFVEARQWFRRSAALRGLRPDARLYTGCLEALTSFSDGGDVAMLASKVSEDAFGFLAWSDPGEGPPWLGARRAEAASWAALAFKLREMAAHLGADSWWEPAAVIEEHLLVAYCAGRAILKRGRVGGLEAMIRPRIEGSLVKERYQAHLLKTWLSHNTDDEWRPEAEALVARVDALMAAGDAGHPPEAATGRPTVAALVNGAAFPQPVKAAILDVINVHIGNMTRAETEVIESCLEAAQSFSDYQENAAGRSLFNAILMWTVRFLASRLDLTKGDAPTIGYLFEQPGGSLPHEDALQNDYFNFMNSNVLGTEIEVSNVGGGRADLRFSYSPERLVAEIKRESDDASFDGLSRHYAAQTSDYQNTSIRLGFLLVLDQTALRAEGTPHLRHLVKPHNVQRVDEPDPRLVVIVKVPGRRMRPSDLTKAAGLKRVPHRPNG